MSHPFGVGLREIGVVLVAEFETPSTKVTRAKKTRQGVECDIVLIFEKDGQQ